MFIYPIFVGCESGSGTEGEGFAGKEIGDRMPLMRHGQFDFLLGISGIADDNHGMFFLKVYSFKDILAPNKQRNKRNLTWLSSTTYCVAPKDVVVIYNIFVYGGGKIKHCY